MKTKSLLTGPIPSLYPMARRIALAALCTLALFATAGTASASPVIDGWSIGPNREILKDGKHVAAGYAKVLWARGEDVWVMGTDNRSYHLEAGRWVLKWAWDVAEAGFIGSHYSVTGPERAFPGEGRVDFAGWSVGPNKETLKNGQHMNGGYAKTLFVLGSSPEVVWVRGTNDGAYFWANNRWLPAYMWTPPGPEVARSIMHIGFTSLGYKRVFADAEEAESRKKAAEEFIDKNLSFATVKDRLAYTPMKFYVNQQGRVVYTGNDQWPNADTVYISGYDKWVKMPDGKLRYFYKGELKDTILIGKFVTPATWPTGSEETMEKAGYIKVTRSVWSFDPKTGDVLMDGAPIQYTDASAAKSQTAPTYKINESTVIYVSPRGDRAIFGKSGEGAYIYSKTGFLNDDGLPKWVAYWHGGWWNNDENATRALEAWTKIEKK